MDEVELFALIVVLLVFAAALFGLAPSDNIINLAY